MSIDWKSRAEAAEAENTRLRAALAQSELPCVYCSLPMDEWEKCKSGFPGCARADDVMGCPELGARMQLEAAEARISWFENQISHYKEDLRVQKASHEARVKELEGALEWYMEQVKTMSQFGAALTAALEECDE